MKIKTTFCKGENPNSGRIYSPEVIEIFEHQLSDKIQRNRCMVETWHGEHGSDIIPENVVGIVTDYEWTDDDWLVIDVKPRNVPASKGLIDGCIIQAYISARVFDDTGVVMADDFTFIKFVHCTEL